MRGDEQEESEGHSDGEMEGEVAVVVVVCDGVVVASAVGRVDCFHAGIEADNEEVRIHAESKSVAGCDLFDEGAEAELAAWLVFVFTDGPDVAGIDKDGSAKFPEEFGTVLKTEVELDVATLVQEVDAPVFAVVSTRTEGTHRPTSEAIGTTRKVAFLERKLVGVAVWVRDAEAAVEGD